MKEKILAADEMLSTLTASGDALLTIANVRTLLSDVYREMEVDESNKGESADGRQ